jgi:hypothetical protein
VSLDRKKWTQCAIVRCLPSFNPIANMRKISAISEKGKGMKSQMKKPDMGVWLRL